MIRDICSPVLNPHMTLCFQGECFFKLLPLCCIRPVFSSFEYSCWANSVATLFFLSINHNNYIRKANSTHSCCPHTDHTNPFWGLLKTKVEYKTYMCGSLSFMASRYGTIFQMFHCQFVFTERGAAKKLNIFVGRSLTVTSTMSTPSPSYSCL